PRAKLAARIDLTGVLHPVFLEAQMRREPTVDHPETRFPRRTVVIGIALAAVSSPARAHHGWAWTEDGFFELEGRITAIYIGNPHATLDVDVEGEIWRVE